MRIRGLSRCLGLVGAAGLFIGVSSGHAQVVLEPMGTVYLSQAQSHFLKFRWKWDGPVAVTSASWQVTYSPVGTSATPVVVHSGVLTPPPKLTYGDFGVMGSNLPAGAPPTFHVRVRVSGGYSKWVPVTLPLSVPVTPPPPPPASSPATQPPPPTSVGAAPPPLPTTSRTASPTGKALLPPPPPTSPKPGQTFVIPGGGIEATPLWVVLTQIQCTKETNDEGDSDEIYAITVAVAPNLSSPSQSKVRVSASPVFNDVDETESITLYLPIWGPSGTPMPIDTRESAIIYLTLVELDKSNPAVVSTTMQATILANLKTLASGTRFSDFHAALQKGISSGWSLSTVGGYTGEVIDTKLLELSDADLQSARAGKAIVNLVSFIGNRDYGGIGSYKAVVRWSRAGTP